MAFECGFLGQLLKGNGAGWPLGRTNRDVVSASAIVNHVNRTAIHRDSAGRFSAHASFAAACWRATSSVDISCEASIASSTH